MRTRTRIAVGGVVGALALVGAGGRRAPPPGGGGAPPRGETPPPPPRGGGGRPARPRPWGCASPAA